MRSTTTRILLKAILRAAFLVSIAAAPSVSVAQQAGSPESGIKMDATAPLNQPPVAAMPAAPSSGSSSKEPSVMPLSSESAEQASPGKMAPSLASSPSVAPLLPQTSPRADLPQDLSPWGMFMSADWVVKAVMIGLALASLVTWTVCLAKAIEVACARARAKRAFHVIASSESLGEAHRALANRGGPAVFMVRSSDEELRRSAPVLDHAGNGGVKERVVSRLARIEAQAGRRLARGTGLLATIGATAPFVGLFGTVWGIMNSFIGISQSQTTNLAVVAPGIAEALLTTAFGLVAAVPAVVIYNVFARAVTGYRQDLADAAAGIEQLVSLELDIRRMPGVRKAATSAVAAE